MREVGTVMGIGKQVGMEIEDGGRAADKHTLTHLGQYQRLALPPLPLTLSPPSTPPSPPTSPCPDPKLGP